MAHFYGINISISPFQTLFGRYYFEFFILIEKIHVNENLIETWFGRLVFDSRRCPTTQENALFCC